MNVVVALLERMNGSWLFGTRIETKNRSDVKLFLTSGCDLLYTITLVGIASVYFGTRRTHRCLTSCS